MFVYTMIDFGEARVGLRGDIVCERKLIISIVKVNFRCTNMKTIEKQRTSFDAKKNDNKFRVHRFLWDYWEAVLTMFGVRKRSMILHDVKFFLKVKIC